MIIFDHEKRQQYQIIMINEIWIIQYYIFNYMYMFHVLTVITFKGIIYINKIIILANVELLGNMS